MNNCQQKKKFKIEFAHSLFKSLCKNDKYKDVYNDDTDKVSELISSITDDYQESIEYILGNT